MSKRYEIRFSGSGGQGIILASIILTEAALVAGYNAVQSQSYGPEARGGLCRAEIIIAEGDIGFTKVVTPSFLLALTQSSLEKYASVVPDECVVLADASLDVPNRKNFISAPIIQTAKEKVGKAFTANIVALGVINSIMKFVPQSALEEAVKKYIPKGTEELNMLALKEGAKLK